MVPETHTLDVGDRVFLVLSYEKSYMTTDYVTGVIRSRDGEAFEIDVESSDVMTQIRHDESGTIVRTESLSDDEPEWYSARIETIYQLRGVCGVFVYGMSDDLIEISGSVGEEFYADYKQDTTIQINDALVNVRYGTGGIWEVTVTDAGSASNTHQFDDGSEISNALCDYSEVAVLEFDEPIENVEKL